jgi:hypothetical protein
VKKWRFKDQSVTTYEATPGDFFVVGLFIWLLIALCSGGAW